MPFDPFLHPESIRSTNTDDANWTKQTPSVSTIYGHGLFCALISSLFKNNQYEDKEGINQCRFEFQARGEHRKYKILFQTWIPFSVFILFQIIW